MARNSKFSGPFIAVPRWVLQYITTDYVSHAVMNHLLQYINPDTQELWTSYQHIADQIGCDRRTVIRSIKRLEEIGLIIKVPQTRNNRNIPNRYYVNFNNPSVVSPESPLVVSPESLGSVTSDTPSSVSSDTQSRIRNKKEIKKKGTSKKVDVDWRLLNEETD